PVSEAGRHGGARPTGRPAGAVAGAPRRLGVAVMRVVAERAHRQFREVQAAQRDGAGGLQPGDGRRLMLGSEVLGVRRAAGGGPPAPDAETLVGERYPVEGAPGAPGLRLGLANPSRPERSLGIDLDEGVEPGADGLDPGEARLRRLDRRDLAGANLRGELGERVSHGREAPERPPGRARGSPRPGRPRSPTAPRPAPDRRRRARPPRPRARAPAGG